MKLHRIAMLAILGVGVFSTASASDCRDDELTFNFSNIRTREAFAVMADFAGLRPQIDASIESSGPLKFVCTPWRAAAEELATKYNLRLRVENGVMYVTR